MHIFTSKIKSRIKTTILKRDLIRSDGFTIVELMIASAVFSLVLILITYGVISFNQAYYGGVVQASTQNVAHAILDNLSQSIQFDGGEVATVSGGGWNGICVGNQFYQVQPGMELVTNGGTLGPDQVTQALLQTGNVTSCSGQIPGTVGGTSSGTAGGTELLGDHMRIAVLTASPVSGTNLYQLHIRVVYGDDDLICAQSVAGSCSNPSSTNGATAADAQCKSTTGTPQFCAVSDLNTTDQKRVN